jgi:hypothetical protein
MPEVVAKVAQEYAHRRIEPGERFHVEPAHVGILAAIGRIEPLEASAKDMHAAPADRYRTRDMAAERPKAPKKTRNRQPILTKAR